MTRTGLALTVALAALAALAVAAPTAGAAFPGKPGWIAFQSMDRQDDQFLYRIQPSGGQVRRLQVDGGYPSYSADGRFVAWAENGQLMVAETSGSNRQPLVNGQIQHSSWSPGGDEIVFTSINEEDEPSLWIVDLATRGARHLANGEDPSWSPDGRTIVYNTPNGTGLCTIRPDGTGSRCFKPVTNDGARDPDWSPGGRAIAVAIRDRIAILRADGRLARWISPPIKTSGPIATRVFNPSWSPDGKRLVYERGKGSGRGSLYVTGDRGGRQRYLTGGTDPVWSPRR